MLYIPRKIYSYYTFEYFFQYNILLGKMYVCDFCLILATTF